MTCEICNASRMDVTTYNLNSVEFKINACTPCIRKIDIVIGSLFEKYRDEATEYIKSCLEIGKSRREEEMGEQK